MLTVISDIDGTLVPSLFTNENSAKYLTPEFKAQLDAQQVVTNAKHFFLLLEESIVGRVTWYFATGRKFSQYGDITQHLIQSIGLKGPTAIMFYPEDYQYFTPMYTKWKYLCFRNVAITGAMDGKIFTFEDDAEVHSQWSKSLIPATHFLVTGDLNKWWEKMILQRWK